MNTPAETLTSEEQQELVNQERVIQHNLHGFEAVGTALVNIKNKRLYRDSYTTWKEYCQCRWNMTARWANDLIADSEIAHEIKVEAEKVEEKLPLPENQAQVHALRDVPKEKRVEVLKEAAESNRGFLPNAEEIKKVAAKHAETKIVSKGLKRVNQQKLLDSITAAICKYEETFSDAESLDVLRADLLTHAERLESDIDALTKKQAAA